MYRFYVNAQETHSVAADWIVEFQEKANTFALYGGYADGTNHLLYAGCGEYLCVVEHPDFGPVIGTSPLILDINDASPLPKFLFDFVPNSVKHTFSIRSQFNQKYLRCIHDEHNICIYVKQKILCNEEIEDVQIFPVDGTKITATEFVLSPVSVSYADNNKAGDTLKQNEAVPTNNC